MLRSALLVLCVCLLAAGPARAQMADDLISALGAGDWDTRQAAQEALMQLASNSVDHVISACNDTLHNEADPEIRYRARQVLVHALGHLVFGTKKRGFLGVSLQQSFIEQVVDGRKTHTVDIMRALPEHQAVAHGVKTGHRIVSIDSHWCTLKGFNMRALIDYVAAKQPGYPLKVGLLEGNTVIEKTIPLGARPHNPGDPPVDVQRQRFVDAWLRQNAPTAPAIR